MNHLRRPFIRGMNISNELLEREIARAQMLQGNGKSHGSSLADMARIDPATGGLTILQDTVQPQRVIFRPGAPPAAAGPDAGAPPPQGPEALTPGVTELGNLQLLLARAVFLLEEIATTPLGPTPRSFVDRATTTSADYVDVARWDIPQDRRGSLYEVSMVSDTPALAQWRLTVADVVQWADVLLQTALTIPFRDNELPGDASVILQVKSDGATTIVADGSIASTERDPM